MPRPRKSDHQFDLFSRSLTATTVEIPPWQSLPAETRQKLTALMARLILQCAARAGGTEGQHHDQ